MSLTHKSQSALEYMMTYGWAILIIVIVAGVLYSFGVFNPSSSASATITGFSGLGSVTAECFPGGGLVLQLGNSVGSAIQITKINTTSQTGTHISVNFSTNIALGSTVNFAMPSACANSTGTKYSNVVSITYTEPGQVFPGPYFSTGVVQGKAVSQGLAANFTGDGIIVAYGSSGFGTNTTMAFWERVISPPSGCCNGDMVILSNANNGGQSWVRYQNTTSYDFSDEFYTAIGPNLQWNLIVVTHSAPGSDKFYLNGTLVHTGSSGQRAFSDVDMGAWQNGPSQFYTGKLADVQVYNTTLSAQKITQLYNEGFGGAPLLNENLTGWWPLDGNANDYSGNNNNGVPTNVQWVSP